MDCYYVDKTEHARRLVGQVLFPVASAPVRQELAGGHAAGAGKRGVVPGPRRARRVGLVSAPSCGSASAAATPRTSWNGSWRRRRGAPASNPSRRRTVSGNWSCTSAPGSGRSCWWTSTTSRFALGDRELANRNCLRGFYAMIKDNDRHLRFVFLTGVSKLAGLFSGLNNLRDITLAPEFSDICGYMDDELDAVFAPELDGLDREKIRRWYNGYNWRGPERLYNPFGILLLLAERGFGNYWFLSGTPTFMVETLARRRISAPALEGMFADDDLLSAVDRISVEALPFQTGYLTVAGEEQDEDAPLYRLDYPNREAQPERAPAAPDVAVAAESRELRRLANDFAGLERLFRAFLASNEWYANTGLAGAHYASVLALRGGGDRRPRRGEHGARPFGPCGPVRRRRLPVRVQGRGREAARPGAGADSGARLRRQVPASGRAGPPDRVRPGGAQHRRVRDRLKPGAGSVRAQAAPPRKAPADRAAGRHALRRERPFPRQRTRLAVHLSSQLKARPMPRSHCATGFGHLRNWAVRRRRSPDNRRRRRPQNGFQVLGRGHGAYMQKAQALPGVNAKKLTRARRSP